MYQDKNDIFNLNSLMISLFKGIILQQQQQKRFLSGSVTPHDQNYLMTRHSPTCKGKYKKESSCLGV